MTTKTKKQSTQTPKYAYDPSQSSTSVLLHGSRVIPYSQAKKMVERAQAAQRKAAKARGR